MRVRIISDDPNFLRGVNRTIFRGLRDGDGPRLHMVLIADVVQVLTNSSDGDFAVGRWDRQQLAADVFLCGSAFRGVDMGGLGADDPLMGLHHAVQTEYVRRRAAENQKHLGVFAKSGTDSVFSFAGVRIVTVRWNVSDVRGRHRR